MNDALKTYLRRWDSWVDILAIVVPLGLEYFGRGLPWWVYSAAFALRAVSSILGILRARRVFV